MIRLPNKLYPFSESVLADFIPIKQALSGRRLPVADLYAEVAQAMSAQDFIEALTLLLTLKHVELDVEEGVIWSA